MAKIHFDDIQIIEPPLQEFSKKSSFFKSGCLGGCGCLVLLIVSGIIGWRLAFGPGPSTSTTIPSNFPSSIPLYDREAIEQVTLIPGKSKQRREKVAMLLPQLITKPFDDTSSSTTREILQELWSTLTESPIASDTILLEWHTTSVDLKFISGYYKKELNVKDYSISNSVSTAATEQFSFKNKDAGIEGIFTAETRKVENKNVVTITLEVKVPAK